MARRWTASMQQFSSMLKQKLPVLVLAGPSCSWLPRGIEHGEGCLQVGDEYIAGLVLFARERSKFARTQWKHAGSWCEGKRQSWSVPWAVPVVKRLNA